MSKKIFVVVGFIIAVSMMLAACGVTFEKGDAVLLEKSHLVNPHNYGDYFWLQQQRNNCTLRAGRAILVRFSKKDPSQVLVSQPNCSGWTSIHVLEKPVAP